MSPQSGRLDEQRLVSQMPLGHKVEPLVGRLLQALVLMVGRLELMAHKVGRLAPPACKEGMWALRVCMEVEEQLVAVWYVPQ